MGLYPIKITGRTGGNPSIHKSLGTEEQCAFIANKAQQIAFPSEHITLCWTSSEEYYNTLMTAPKFVDGCCFVSEIALSNIQLQEFKHQQRLNVIPCLHLEPGHSIPLGHFICYFCTESVSNDDGRHNFPIHHAEVNLCDCWCLLSARCTISEMLPLENALWPPQEFAVPCMAPLIHQYCFSPSGHDQVDQHPIVHQLNSLLVHFVHANVCISVPHHIHNTFSMPTVIFQKPLHSPSPISPPNLITNEKAKNWASNQMYILYCTAHKDCPITPRNPFPSHSRNSHLFTIMFTQKCVLKK